MKTQIQISFPYPKEDSEMLALVQGDYNLVPDTYHSTLSFIKEAKELKKAGLKWDWKRNF